MKKVAFMGADPIAIPLLNHLLAEQSSICQLSGIISQPDRPSGRGKKVTPNTISTWALEHNIPLLRPEKPSETERQWLIDEKIDLVLVMAYGHIIKKALLDTPPLGMVNFHASLLPAYRGASPIETALASGETLTGVTLMKMVLKMDAGAIINKENVPITSNDTSATLRNKIAQACVPLLQNTLLALLQGNADAHPQDESLVSYTRKIHKSDSWLNFNNPAKILETRIRAFTPQPGTFFKINDTAIKIGSASVLEDTLSAIHGTVITQNAHGLTVATSENHLVFTSLQRPGGKMLPTLDFLHGFPIPNNIQLQSGPMPPLLSL